MPSRTRSSSFGSERFAVFGAGSSASVAHSFGFLRRPWHRRGHVGNITLAGEGNRMLPACSAFGRREVQLKLDTTYRGKEVRLKPDTTYHGTSEAVEA